MQKRGQITVFIVVGILILFSVGFVLYIASIRPDIQLFAEEESELQQYIGFCLAQTSQEAIEAVSTRGGYADVPEDIASNERAYFSFSQRTEPKIPLWYYRGEWRIPQKSFMAEQIAAYVVANIDSCLNGFASFKNRYELQLTGPVTANTTIAADNVIVKLDYPLQAREYQSGDITQLHFVSRTLDAKLGRMHDLATDILKAETQKLFFENLTIDLLSTAQEQFPFTGMEFSCAPKQWRKSELAAFAQSMISANIHQVTVVGNKYQLFDRSDIYARNHYSFDIGKRYGDIGVSFQYPTSSRFELHVRPNDREYLRSNVGRPQNLLAPFLCINTWHYTYDVEYPLLVSLQDSSAFGGDGLLFNFGFPVTIFSNQGQKADMPIKEFESEDYSYNFCTDVASQQVDIRVRDAFTFEEIYRADVDYRCVRYVCNLGQTTATNGVYQIRTQLPAACTAGLLQAHKEGYLSGQATYEGGSSAEVFLTPLKSFKVTFVKHDSDDLTRTDPLLPGESVAVYIKSPQHPGYEQIYSSESPLELSLINGEADYSIEALLMQDNERMIGGYIGTLHVNYGDIAQASEITFHLVQKIPIAVTEAEQQAAAEYLFSDQSYQQPLRPTFS